MNNFDTISNSARSILSNIETIQRDYHKMVERNSNLIKALATIKCQLERTLKQPANLNNTVYECINLARELTPYTNNGKTVIDSPLTDAEKTLP